MTLHTASSPSAVRAAQAPRMATPSTCTPPPSLWKTAALVTQTATSCSCRSKVRMLTNCRSYQTLGAPARGRATGCAPTAGTLYITTELGRLTVAPGEICGIPRGIRFAVALPPDGSAVRGYVLEVFASHFQLPDLGPIGANGLANARDFLTPTAWYEERTCSFTVLHKLDGRLFASGQVGTRAPPPPHVLRTSPYATNAPAITAGFLSFQRRGVARQLCAVQVRLGQVLPDERRRL